jgi:trehalose 6-phosphate phosphatase
MPKPLMQSLGEVDERIQHSHSVALFLDFDGTLTPIVSDPVSAQLSSSVRETLQRLARRDSLVTTIISGRAVEDVYLRVRVDGLIYAGNHGLEIFGRGLRFIEPAAEARRGRLNRVMETLAAKLRHVAGVLVENKGLSGSIHFRQADPDDVQAVEDALRTSVAEAGAWFRLSRGRKVFEIVPRTGWHKGAAAQWILGKIKENPALPIYLGDDDSDEDAFAVLTDAVTVRVGYPPATCARYSVPGPAEVLEFLLWLECHISTPRIVTRIVR